MGIKCQGSLLLWCRQFNFPQRQTAQKCTDPPKWCYINSSAADTSDQYFLHIREALCHQHERKNLTIRNSNTDLSFKKANKSEDPSSGGRDLFFDFCSKWRQLKNLWNLTTVHMTFKKKKAVVQTGLWNTDLPALGDSTTAELQSWRTDEQICKVVDEFSNK